MDSWWALPRRWRRRQLHPFVVPGCEPGDELVDSVVHCWEAADSAADGFLAAVLSEQSLALRGTFVDHDHRPGREMEEVKFRGVAVGNPGPNLVDDGDSEDGE